MSVSDPFFTDVVDVLRWQLQASSRMLGLIRAHADRDDRATLEQLVQGLDVIRDVTERLAVVLAGRLEDDPDGVAWQAFQAFLRDHPELDSEP